MIHISYSSWMPRVLFYISLLCVLSPSLLTCQAQEEGGITMDDAAPITAAPVTAAPIVVTNNPTPSPISPSPTTFTPTMVPTETPIPIVYNIDEVSMPRFRFQLWDDLTSELQDLAWTVGYRRNASDWHTFYKTRIETKAYSDVGPNRQKILREMGFTEGTWDCWMNHYGGYYWTGLATYGIQEYYVTLGWNEKAWYSENATDYPASHTKQWNELTDDERQAAANLCYIPETWNNDVPFEEWITTSEYLKKKEPWAPFECIEEIPSGGCSVCGDVKKCVSNPDAIFSFPGLPDTTCGEVQTLGYNGDTMQCQFFVFPEFEVCGCKMSESDAAAAANETIPITPGGGFGGDVYYNEDQISLPKFRFQRWDDYDKKELVSKELGYDAASWNVFATHGIEKVAFEDLVNKQYILKEWRDKIPNNEPIKILEEIGFTIPVWDCWINHYVGYEWSTLEQYGLDKYWGAGGLGYDAKSWSSTNPADWPASSLKGWYEFTEEEKIAAANLCYLPQTWNGESMDDGWLDTSAYLNTEEPWANNTGNGTSTDPTSERESVSDPLAFMKRIIYISVGTFFVWVISIVALVYVCRRSRLRKRAIQESMEKSQSLIPEISEISTHNKKTKHDDENSSDESKLSDPSVLEKGGEEEEDLEDIKLNDDDDDDKGGSSAFMTNEVSC